MALRGSMSPEAKLRRVALERGLLQRTLAQGMRFVGLGLLSYPLGLLITASLHEGVGLRAEASTAIALGCLVVFNFALSRRYVFRVRGRAGVQLMKYAPVSLGMRGTEYLLFLLMLRYGGLNYLVSLTAAMGISAGVKFLLYRNFVFHAGNTENWRSARPEDNPVKLERSSVPW